MSGVIPDKRCNSGLWVAWRWHHAHSIEEMGAGVLTPEASCGDCPPTRCDVPLRIKSVDRERGIITIEGMGRR